MATRVLSERSPYEAFDRWLLEVIDRSGAVGVQDFATSPVARKAGGTGHGDDLSAEEIRQWMDSAQARGLLECHKIDVAGDPLEPPTWGLSNRGRERLATTRMQGKMIPPWLAKALMPGLSVAAKTAFAAIPVYLAARSTHMLPKGATHNTISVAGARYLLIAVIAIGLAVYLLIRFTDYGSMRDRALNRIRRRGQQMSTQSQPARRHGVPTGEAR